MDLESLRFQLLQCSHLINTLRPCYTDPFYNPYQGKAGRGVLISTLPYNAYARLFCGARGVEGGLDLNPNANIRGLGRSLNPKPSTLNPEPVNP